MPEDFEEILVPRVQIVQTMRNAAHAFHTEMGAACVHEFFVEVQFSDFVDPRPVVKQKFRRSWLRSPEHRRGVGVAVLPSCAHAICDAEADPHGPEDWEGDEIFLDAVYRQAVDVLFMQAVQVPQEKFLHIWERTRCCSLRLLSTQGTFRITTAKIASKESRELVVCTTGARLSFVATWHEEAFLSKEVLWEFRRVETQGRRDADGEGHKTVSDEVEVCDESGLDKLYIVLGSVLRRTDSEQVCNRWLRVGQAVGSVGPLAATSEASW